MYKYFTNYSYSFILETFNNFLYVLSINIAPRGAVINIEITAPVKTIVPQFNPSDNAIAPIEA